MPKRNKLTPAHWQAPVALTAAIGNNAVVDLRLERRRPDRQHLRDLIEAQRLAANRVHAERLRLGL